MGGCDGFEVIQKIELEHTNKLLEEAGIDPIDTLPEEKKSRWTGTKRVGIAALVTAAVLGYYFTRPGLPVQQREEKIANIYVLGNNDFVWHTRGSGGDNLKIFSGGKLEYDLYDYNSDGKVDELFSPPNVYIRRDSMPRHRIPAENLLKNADELWKAIKENSQ